MKLFALIIVTAALGSANAQSITAAPTSTAASCAAASSCRTSSVCSGTALLSCVCTQLSSESSCLATMCPGYPLPTDVSFNLSGNCQAQANTPQTTAAGVATTAASGGSATATGSVVTSASKAGANPVAVAGKAGGLLAGIVGILAYI